MTRRGVAFDLLFHDLPGMSFQLSPSLLLLHTGCQLPVSWPGRHTLSMPELSGVVREKADSRDSEKSKPD